MPWELNGLSVLHIGGGTFFYEGNSYNEIPETHEHHFKQTETPIGPNVPPDLQRDLFHSFTEDELKKLKKAEQEEIIHKLNGDVSSATNETDRIALILKLQEELEQMGPE